MVIGDVHLDITVSNQVQFDPILKRAKKPGLRIPVSSHLQITISVSVGQVNNKIEEE